MIRDLSMGFQVFLSLSGRTASKIPEARTGAHGVREAL